MAIFSIVFKYLLKGVGFLLPFFGNLFKKITKKTDSNTLFAVVGLAVVGWLGYSAYRKYKSDWQFQLFATPKKQKAQMVASMVYSYFGKTTSWWRHLIDPTTWGESENKIIDLLGKHLDIINEISSEYESMAGNSLRVDVEQYFNAKQKERFYSTIYNFQL